LTSWLTRLALAALAAAAALATLAGAPALAARAGSGLPAGVPRYYITQDYGNHAPAVRATATGAVTGTVRCPAAGATVEDFVPADNQTIFLDCLVAHGATEIFRFRLTAAGRPEGYQPVRHALFRQPTGSLAVAADGAELALVVLPHNSAADGQVVVLNTSTGARAVWRNGPAGPGMVRLGLGTLSLTASGRELVVFGNPKCQHSAAGNVCRANGQEARAVSPAARGGSLSQSRLVLRQAAITSLREGYINGAVITASGRSLLANVVFGAIRGSSVSVVQVSAATGRRQRVLYRLGTGNGFTYTCVSVDATSRWLLFDAGPNSGERNGWIDRGRLIPLRPAGNTVAYEAWS
jgi:hypothetical protein